MVCFMLHFFSVSEATLRLKKFHFFTHFITYTQNWKFLLVNWYIKLNCNFKHELSHDPTMITEVTKYLMDL